MIVVDTSIWVDHLTRPIPRLSELLDDGAILMHRSVMGEISLGNLPRYDFTLLVLRRIPQAPTADDDDVLRMIRDHRLYGRGIGYVDAHLLASTRLMKGALLWTRDRRLAVLAEGFGVGYVPPDPSHIFG